VGPIDDVTMKTVAYALQGLEARAEVRADNVANLNTPGFRAKQVDFESTLRAALSRDETPGAPSVSASPSLPNPNGSTVDLETEFVGMMQDNLRRDGLINSFNARTNNLRTVIGGQ
jgi:flagellar basal-body rod protein FlgB